MSYVMRLQTAFLPHWYFRRNPEDRMELYNTAAVKTHFGCY